MIDGNKKILPVVLYNQIQAIKFWINYTEAILMNYFSYTLPNFWEVKMLNNKPYYWLNSNKILQDIPTLEVSISTIRNTIRKLIWEWLILREVVNENWKDRAYYRCSDDWLLFWEENKKSIFDEVTWMSKAEKEKLLLLLTWEEKEKKKESKVILSVDDVWWDFYTDEIKKFFEKAVVLFDFDANIDWDYIVEISKHIDFRASLWDYWKLWNDWNKSDSTKKEIIKRLNGVIDWYTYKNKKIKNLKLTLNTFLK